jgi:hypothetical protein
MQTPGFTAERTLAATRGRYRAASITPAIDPAVVTAAFDPVFIQIDDTLFYCYPCMSGGPAGALVTGCCDAVASTAGGMSWA